MKFESKSNLLYLFSICPYVSKIDNVDFPFDSIREVSSFHCRDHPLDRHSWQALSLFWDETSICFLDTSLFKCKHAFNTTKGPPKHNNIVLIEWITEWGHYEYPLYLWIILYASGGAEHLSYHFTVVHKRTFPINTLPTMKNCSTFEPSTLLWANILFSNNQPCSLVPFQFFASSGEPFTPLYILFTLFPSCTNKFYLFFQKDKICN